jgi:hypothetical protein
MAKAKVDIEITPDIVEHRMLSLAMIQQCIIVLEDQDPIGEDYKNRQKAAKTGELLISYLKNFFSDSQHIDEEDRRAFKAFRQATWGILEIVERKLHIQERRRKEASVALRALTHNIDAILQNRESRDKANTAQMVDQLLSISDMMTVLGTLAVRAHSLTPTQIDAYNKNVNQLVQKYRLDIPITEKYKDNASSN